MVLKNLLNGMENKTYKKRIIKMRKFDIVMHTPSKDLYFLKYTNKEPASWGYRESASLYGSCVGGEYGLEAIKMISKRFTVKWFYYSIFLIRDILFNRYSKNIKFKKTRLENNKLVFTY